MPADPAADEDRNDLSPQDKARQGGPEGTTVSGQGGTLPLKDFEPPHYYHPQTDKPPKR